MLTRVIVIVCSLRASTSRRRKRRSTSLMGVRIRSLLGRSLLRRGLRLSRCGSRSEFLVHQPIHRSTARITLERILPLPKHHPLRSSNSLGLAGTQFVKAGVEASRCGSRSEFLVHQPSHRYTVSCLSPLPNHPLRSSKSPGLDSHYTRYILSRVCFESHLRSQFHHTSHRTLSSLVTTPLTIPLTTLLSSLVRVIVFRSFPLHWLTYGLLWIARLHI